MGSLRDINHALMAIEHENRPLTWMEVRDPIFFVVGPPRSGTTVLTQALAYALKAAYITNINARFWLVPVTGARISVDILGDDPAEDLNYSFFTSRRGRTFGGGGIHEFGYFWQSLDWQSPPLYSLQMIQAIYKAPLVMKGIYPARHHEAVRDYFDVPVKFISIARPFQDTCASCLMKLNAYDEEWFTGWELPQSYDKRVAEHATLANIALKVYYWQHYSAEIADYSVYLPNLCTDPEAYLSSFAAYKRPLPPHVLSYRSLADTPEYDAFGFVEDPGFADTANSIFPQWEVDK
jgi:hypothetical protein